MQLFPGYTEWIKQSTVSYMIFWEHKYEYVKKNTILWKNKYLDLQELIKTSFIANIRNYDVGHSPKIKGKKLAVFLGR